MKFRLTILLAVVFLLLAPSSAANPPAAEAQVATYARSFLLDGWSRDFDVAPDGSFLGTDWYSARKFSSGWTLQIKITNSISGGSGATVIHPVGATQLLDGRLVVDDEGGTTSNGIVPRRLAVFSAAGALMAYWPVPAPGNAVGGAIRRSEDGGFYLVLQSSGVTTIQTWSPSGTIENSWTVPTTGSALAVRDGVVYLGGDAAGKIFKFGLDGSSLGALSPPNVGTVLSIAVDGAGRIYALSTFQSYYTLSFLSPTGARIAAQQNIAPGEWAAPSCLTLVDDTKLYVADGSWSYGGVHELNVTAEVVPTLSSSWGRVKALYR